MTNTTNTTTAKKHDGQLTTVTAKVLIIDKNENVSTEEITRKVAYCQSPNTAAQNLAALEEFKEVELIVREIVEIKQEQKPKQDKYLPSRIVVHGAQHSTLDDAKNALTSCKNPDDAIIVELPLYSYSGAVYGYLGDKHEHNLFAEYMTFESPVKWTKTRQRSEIADNAKNVYPSLHVVNVDGAQRNTVKDDSGETVITYWLVDGDNVKDVIKPEKQIDEGEES